MSFGAYGNREPASVCHFFVVPGDGMVMVMGGASFHSLHGLIFSGLAPPVSSSHSVACRAAPAQERLKALALRVNQWRRSLSDAAGLVATQPICI